MLARSGLAVKRVGVDKPCSIDARLSVMAFNEPNGSEAQPDQEQSYATTRF